MNLDSEYISYMEHFFILFHAPGLIGSINILVEQEERFKETIESHDEMYSLIGETKYGKSLHHFTI